VNTAPQPSSDGRHDGRRFRIQDAARLTHIPIDTRAVGTVINVFYGVIQAEGDVIY